jgi:hypothetical protein
MRAASVLFFGIPIEEEEYREIVRALSADIRTWVRYGAKDLTPADNACTAMVNALADELREQGVPHPMVEAWKRIGTPDPKIFPQKLQPGQPLGEFRFGSDPASASPPGL